MMYLHITETIPHGKPVLRSRLSAATDGGDVFLPGFIGTILVPLTYTPHTQMPIIFVYFSSSKIPSFSFKH